MIERKGDMFKKIIPNEHDMILVTTNSYIRKDGALVMGRGAAKTAASMYPRVPYVLGKYIKKYNDHLGVYGIMLNQPIGAFQVKRHFKDDASLSLIGIAVRDLITAANVMTDLTFHVNYPGIGNGRLKKEDVEPIISALPDNVHVWRF